LISKANQEEIGKAKMDDYVRELVDAFKDERSLYEEFGLAVFKLLNSLLQNGGYKYQIFYRVKELGKLEQKVIRRKNEGTIYNGLKEIDDLVGIRIVFYAHSADSGRSFRRNPAGCSG
jgi:hypothetical protein